DGAAGLQGPAAHLSLHDWGVAETLRAMSLLGLHPHHLTVVGAEPGRMDPGTELSPELARARDSLVTLLLQQAPEPGEPRPGGDHPPQADHPPHPTGPPVV
ncbi:MAG: hypothetical protein HZB25_14155, partial [Candidatus Eisenbacteria bacterium]|nr:hypothetical protein [Candidatus Eisenbacteria bacterium]